MASVLENTIVIENASSEVSVVFKKKRGKGERVQLDPGDHVILDKRALDMEFVHEQVSNSPYLRYRARTDVGAVDRVVTTTKAPKKENKTPDEVIAKGLLQDVTKEDAEVVPPKKKEDEELEKKMREGVSSIADYVKDLKEETQFFNEEVPEPEAPDLLPEPEAEDEPVLGMVKKTEEKPKKKRYRRTKKEIEEDKNEDVEAIISELENDDE